MMVKFFKHGRGDAASAINYLLAEHVKAYDDNRDPILDDQGRPTYVRRDPLPEVIEGNPARMQDLIDAVPHQWRYKSGVISFAAEDAPSDDQQREIIEAFEGFACPGLDPDQFEMLWVRHTHAHGVELHFLMPRIELGSQKSLNIAPPGHEKGFGAFVDLHNKRNRWADPLDPARARSTKAVSEAPERAEARTQLHDWVLAQIELGVISDRNTMIVALAEVGFELPKRADGAPKKLRKKMLTVVDPESGESWKLQGAIFHENWTAEQAQPQDSGEHGEPSGFSARLAGFTFEELERRVEEHRQKRLQYNVERYGPAETQRRTADAGHHGPNQSDDRSNPNSDHQLGTAISEAKPPDRRQESDDISVGRSAGDADELGRVISGSDDDDQFTAGHRTAGTTSSRSAAGQPNATGCGRPWRSNDAAPHGDFGSLPHRQWEWSHLHSGRGGLDDADKLGAGVAELRRRARERRQRLHDQIGRTRRYAREVAKGLARIVERLGKLIAGRAFPRNDGGPAREASPWVPQTQQVASPQRREAAASSPPTERRTGPSRSP